MSKKRKKINKAINELLIYVSMLIILLISLFNVTNFLKSKKVLGVSTASLESVSFTKKEQYLKDILRENPGYLPAWKELGRGDKVKEIDPNYITP